MTTSAPSSGPTPACTPAPAPTDGLHPLDREYLELLELAHQQHPEVQLLTVRRHRRGRAARNAALREAIEALG